MALRDTSPEIEAMQVAVRRSMTPARRFDIALELRSERQIMIELFRLAFLPEPLPDWVK